MCTCKDASCVWRHLYLTHVDTYAGHTTCFPFFPFFPGLAMARLQQHISNHSQKTGLTTWAMVPTTQRDTFLKSNSVMPIYSFFNQWLFDCKNLSVLWMMIRLLQFEGTAHRHCLTLLKHFPTPLYFFLVGNPMQTGFNYVNFKACKHGLLA